MNATLEKLIVRRADDLQGWNSAVFNETETHRYLLRRRWAEGGSTLTFIMLNPSTADEDTDDPTIRRCMGFARREGAHALRVANLFGLRATDPKELLRHPAPVGARNEEFLRLACLPEHEAVVAWGALPSGLRGHAARMTEILALDGVRLRCFGTTASGQPRHPLYLRGDMPLVPHNGHPIGG